MHLPSRGKRRENRPRNHAGGARGQTSPKGSNLPQISRPANLRFGKTWRLGRCKRPAITPVSRREQPAGGGQASARPGLRRKGRPRRQTAFRGARPPPTRPRRGLSQGKWRLTANSGRIMVQPGFGGWSAKWLGIPGKLSGKAADGKAGFCGRSVMSVARAEFFRFWMVPRARCARPVLRPVRRLPALRPAQPIDPAGVGPIRPAAAGPAERFLPARQTTSQAIATRANRPARHRASIDDDPARRHLERVAGVGENSFFQPKTEHRRAAQDRGRGARPRGVASSRTTPGREAQ